MANAKKCDRCLTYYDIGDLGVSKNGNYVSGIAFTRHNNVPTASIDLCKECISKINRFIDGAEIILED